MFSNPFSAELYYLAFHQIEHVEAASRYRHPKLQVDVNHI